MLKRILGRLRAFWTGVWAYARRHKIQAGLALLILVALAWWGYTAYQKSVTTTQYVLTPARMEPIAQTVSASGQVASQHQLNLSPKSGGTLTSVNVVAGQHVAAGQLIATVDDRDAVNSLHDAAIALANAKLTYQESQTSNANTVQKSSNEVFTTSASVYSDTSTVLTGINNIMQGDEVSGSFASRNVYAYSKLFDDNPALVGERDKLIAQFANAQDAYTAAYADYSRTSRSADAVTISRIANETYDAVEASAQAAKDLNDYLNDVNSRYSPNDNSKPAILATHRSASNTYLSTMNSDLALMQTAKDDLASAIQTSDSGNSISQEQALLSYQKAQNAYKEAQDAVANYFVRAPFPGTIAQVPLQRYDTAGSGATVAVLITKEQYVTLSLNEVDAAKVAVGQKTSLTFDAIPDLTLDGSVAEVDLVGSVSQGVVSYDVKIGFDTQDARVLPGMTANATIVTASKDSALVVPASAVKNANGVQYVEVATFTNGAPLETNRGAFGSTTASATRPFASTTPATGSSTVRSFGAMGGTGRGLTVPANSVTLRRVPVTIGITNDTMMEITAGLTPGEFVVSQSLNAAGGTTNQTRPAINLFGGGGARQSGGGTGASGNRNATVRIGG